MLKIFNYLKYSIVLMPLAAFAQQEPEPPAPLATICDVYNLIIKVVNYLLIFVIVIAVLFIIISAFKMVTGDDKAKESGKKGIWTVIIGVVIALLAWSLIAYIIPSFLGINVGNCL